MNNPVLSLLGLALRGGRLAVGEEPAALAAKAGQARLILLAADAAGNTLRRAEFLAGEGHCLTAVLPFSKAELGGALGRGSAAIAALTDLGLAAAVAERLAQQDPERYGDLAQRMDLKRRRAKERQSAPRREAPKRPEKARKPRREGRPYGERRSGRDGHSSEDHRPSKGGRSFGERRPSTNGRPYKGKHPYKGKPPDGKRRPK